MDSTKKLIKTALFSTRMEQERIARERDLEFARKRDALGPWWVMGTGSVIQVSGFDSAMREIRVRLSRGDQEVRVCRATASPSHNGADERPAPARHNMEGKPQ